MGVASSSPCELVEDDEEDPVNVFSLCIQWSPSWWPANLRKTAQLCDKCTAMVTAWQEMRMEPLDTEKDLSLDCEHYETFDQLVLSAEAGCGICHHFSKAVVRSGVKFKTDQLPPSKVVCWVGSARKKNPERYYFWLQFLADLEQRRPLFRTLWIEPAIEGEPAFDYDSVDKPPSTEDALPLCRAWLHKCRIHHRGCDASATGSPPTRLIYLGDQVPRLVITSPNATNVQYATLSHCWGLLQFTTLTSNTLASFQTAIPVDALTKTFKDAISIAKFLAFEYLWIDSLCIIQDSAEDNSTLWDCWSETWKYTSSNKLLPRAWVVQERYLSRRTLHFTNDQIYWECDGRPACEAYPNGYPADQRKDHYENCFQYEKRPLNLRTWSRIVDAYSAAKLTKYTNRFAAVEGPARLIHKENGWDLIAGMWKHDLERQLCWGSSLRLDNTACTLGRAPSWSWMSVKGEIKTDDPLDNGTRLAVKVESIDIEHVAGNMFEGVERAVLRLSCEYLCQGVIMDKHPESRKKDDTQSQKGSSQTQDVSKKHFSRSLLGGCYFGAHRSTKDPDMIRVHWDTMSVPNGDEDMIDAYLLPVKVDKELGLSQAWGLVLQKTGNGSGQYRRIWSFQPTRITNPGVNLRLAAVLNGTDCVANGEATPFSEMSGRFYDLPTCYIDIV